MEPAIASRVAFFRGGACITRNERHSEIDARGMTCEDIVEYTRVVNDTEALKIRMGVAIPGQLSVNVWSKEEGYSVPFDPKSLFEDCVRACCGDALQPAQRYGETGLRVYFPKN